MSTAPDLTPELIREYVISAHARLEKVQSLLQQHPSLLTVRHAWGENDYETALQAAAHVGNRPIAEYLLSQGFPLDICAAAALGREQAVADFLKADATLAQARGAHNISLIYHAALSGNIAIAEMIYAAGNREGYSFALHAAISKGHLEMVRWLLAHGADDWTVKNYEGKSLVTKATELGHQAITRLLREQGAE